MRFFVIIAVIFLGQSVPSKPTTSATTYGLDSNVAYFAGELMDYVIYAPTGYQMITTTARRDGYSCAFIPGNQAYDTANIIIGVNMYRIRGLDFNDVLADDTASLREHYGKTITIHPVDSVTNRNDLPVTTFFLNDTTDFLPHVMVGYFDGGTEVLIFELVTDMNVLRANAEQTFMECLSRFKSLQRGEWGIR